ncbi:MAG: helix-turn-helix transcriptional regulator [bacterium]
MGEIVKSKKAVVKKPTPKLIDGKEIKHIRIDLDINQVYLAERMGITPATLSRIENNHHKMSRPYYKLFKYVLKEIIAEKKIKYSLKFKEV